MVKQKLTIPSDRSGMVAICFAFFSQSAPAAIRAGSKMGCVELCNFHFCCASVFCQPMKKFEFFGATRATRQRHSKRVALGTRMIMTLLRNGISLQTGRNHQSNRCQRRQIEKIRNTTAVSYFFLFSAPALLVLRGSPLTARSFARRSFDRSKNARKKETTRSL